MSVRYKKISRTNHTTGVSETMFVEYKMTDDQVRRIFGKGKFWNDVQGIRSKLPVCITRAVATSHT
jgi:hypothetical protein